MSADNGIYILESPREDGQGYEYRVIHAQAIENIEYDANFHRLPHGEFDDEQLINYFGRAEVLDKESARELAFIKEEEILSDDFCPILEYGISTITMNRPFPRRKKENRKKKTIAASDIGSFFRKKSGDFAYLRISESSIKFLGLDPGYVYGVCHNGNVTKVTPDCQVVPESVETFNKNIQADILWHRGIGAKSKWEK